MTTPEQSRETREFFRDVTGHAIAILAWAREQRTAGYSDDEIASALRKEIRKEKKALAKKKSYRQRLLGGAGAGRQPS